MSRWFILLLFLSAKAAAQFTLSDDLRVSGFGTFTAAKSDSITPVIDQRDLTNQWCYDCDSTLGVQFDWHISDHLRSALQILKRPQDHYSSPQLERAFIEYFNHGITLKAGRLRTPIFIISEYYYVSSAYPWLRLPNEVYNSFRGLTHYDGVVLDWSYESRSWGQWIVSPFYSIEREEKIEQYGQSFDISIKDSLGFSTNWFYEDHQLHLAYVHNDATQKLNNLFIKELKLDMVSLGFSSTFGQWHLQSELLLATHLYANWYASIDYTWQKFTPYITYGQSRRRIDSHSYLLGTTYALTSDINLYAEWQRIYGQNEMMSGQFTRLQDPSEPFDTQVNLVSFGISFTF